MKYNLKIMAVATIILVLLLCLFGYISAPSSDSFIEAINPWSAITGIVFALAYVGVPIVIAVVLFLAILLAIWFLLLIVAQRIIK